MKGISMNSEIQDIDSSVIFLTEEERILNKTMSIREEIADELTRGGPPTKTGEIRVLNEVLNSMDGQVFSKSDKRLKHTENENDKDMSEIIKNVLLDTRTGVPDRVVVDEDRVLTLELDGSDVVPGEDKIEYDALELSDFVKDGE